MSCLLVALSSLWPQIIMPFMVLYSLTNWDNWGSLVRLSELPVKWLINCNRIKLGPVLDNPISLPYVIREGWKMWNNWQDPNVSLSGIWLNWNSRESEFDGQMGSIHFTSQTQLRPPIINTFHDDRGERCNGKGQQSELIARCTIQSQYSAILFVQSIRGQER